MHLHSKASNLPGGWFSKLIGCPESYADPMDIYKRLKERGMDFVTITDHNTIEGVLEIAHLPDVFISCEYTVEFPEELAMVHVIAYGISQKDHEELSKLRGNVYEFVSYLKQYKIPHTLAHPLYSVQGTKITKRLTEKMILLFDNWEVINGTRGNGVSHIEESIARMYDGWEKINQLEEKYKIRTLRSRPKISFTAGSDDHGGMDVGRTWTVVKDAKDVQSFLMGLWEGKTDTGTEKLGYERILNIVAKVGYDHIQSRYTIPFEIRPFLDYIFMYSDNPAVGMMLKYALGVNGERQELLKNILNNLPFFSLRRFVQRQSLQGVGEVVLSFILHILPAFLKHAQRREEEKIRSLSAEFGIDTAKPVKVAYFTDTYEEINGVARTAKIMRKIAQEEDMPYTFVICTEEGFKDGNLVSLRANFRIPVPFYEELRMGVPSFLELVDFIEKKGFTNLHIASPGPLGLMAFLAGKLLNLRVTFTFHTDVPSYAKSYTRDENLEEFLWKAFELLMNSCDRCFVPSEHYRKLLSNKGVSYSKLSLFRRGVDAELFSPYKREENFWGNRLGIRRDSKVILYVGRVAKEKGLDSFMYVARAFPEEHFVIVGDGPYREELERKKPKNVHFVGYMKGEELAKAYASSHIFLFPSETDTYAQVVLEAMASGLPVIVSSKGGAHEHIQDGVNGLIATKPEEFVNKVSLLLLDDNLRRRISFEAFKKAQELDMRKTYIDYMNAIAGFGRLVYETR